jgi:hypothetical protein
VIKDDADDKPFTVQCAAGGSKWYRAAELVTVPAAVRIRPGAVPLSSGGGGASGGGGGSAASSTGWQWRDGGGWKDYTAGDAATLEAAHKVSPKGAVALTNKWGVYDIDFSKMSQTKRGSGFVRPIRRQKVAAVTAAAPQAAAAGATGGAASSAAGGGDDSALLGTIGMDQLFALKQIEEAKKALRSVLHFFCLLNSSFLLFAHIIFFVYAALRPRSAPHAPPRSSPSWTLC